MVYNHFITIFDYLKNPIYNFHMDTISYLKNIYGYDTPIFLKDIRIGRKSKTAIKQDLYRAYKKGEIKKEAAGIYYFENQQSEFPDEGIGFEEILESKYLYDFYSDYPELDKKLFVKGYYTGHTFLNQIGISTQVPAIREITTNNTSSKKREITINGRTAIIRKPKIEINQSNWAILQFLDMFHFLTLEEVKANKRLLIDYIDKKFFLRSDLKRFIHLYGFSTVKKLTEGGIINAFK